jgi:hypothetical protein
MRSTFGLKTLAGLVAAVALLTFGVVGAQAQNGFHGIAFNKGCDSPTNIGDPYSCAYQLLNVVDTNNDTLQVTGLSDQVHAAGGDVNSGNILGALQLVFSDATVSCVGGTGLGTVASPYVGATSCLIPKGSFITTNDHSFYTVAAADFGLPGHSLTDTATLSWADTCDHSTAPTNCTNGAQTATAGSSSTINQLSSSTATDIHNAAHQTVLAVGTGTTVHDFVTVTGQPGSPNPTGNVSIDWFLNGTCDGAPAANSGNIALAADGTVDATGFAFTVNSAGHRAFRATYLGDATYTGSTGPCEPLTVVDANIQLTPPTATNQIATNHVLTCHVNVNDGNGSANAPAGTICTGQILTGPGSFVGSNQCATVGTTGDCTLTITSNATGQTTVRAATDVAVGGVTLHRETGDAHAGDSANATKLWVNAAIVIAPNATNEVGAPHTFTVTVLQDTGSGLVAVGAGLPCNVTLTNGNGATANPAGPFNLTTNASGQCAVTFTSATGGTVTGHASSTVTINGVVMPVATNGVAPNSGDAVKTFVDANIQITPGTDTDPVGDSHVLTCHINVNTGSGGFANAPAGTVCTVNITAGPGTPATQNCVIGAGGDCTVSITSATPGTSTIQATTTVSVGGVSLTRTTGDAHAGDGPNATKNWVAARISIAPNATNEVGQPHTFTVTVEQDTGSGFAAVPAGTPCNITLTNGGGAVANPAGPFNLTTNASGQCSVTFTSNSTGTVTGHASSTLSVGGQTVTVQTNGVAPNSADAVKTFVNANIQITPATANNPVGTNHVLTITVNAVNGTIDAGAHTATASISSGPGSFVGSPSCTYTGGTATASCTVTITSATAGTTVVSATSVIPVSGVNITRTTGTAANTAAGGSGTASKNWGDVTNVTHVRDAANNDITNTTVNAGTVVHDEATVAKTAGTPAGVPDPTGTVTFTLYNNGSCDGTVLATDANKPLSGGTATSATFTTPAATAGTFSYRAHYNGDANYPAKDAACEPFSTKTAPTGLIAPTQTTCSDVLNGTAAVLGQVNYSLSGGRIGQGINPGVFFFYSKITTTVPNQVVTVTQSNTSTNNTPLFGILNGQAWLWSGDCSSKLVGSTLGVNDSQATFTVPTPGSYIIGIKYQTKTIAGANAPVPADITYNFATSLGGQTGASVLLKKQ